MATTHRKIAAGQPSKNNEATSGDPLSVNARLYRQIARLLDDLEAADRDERMTMPQRIAALIAVGRVQVIFANLRKNSFNDGTIGSQVRKYSAAFARPRADAVGKRAHDAGPSGLGVGDDDDDDGVIA